MTDYYEFLGISEDASEKEVKKAWKEKTQENHADMGGEREAFEKVIAVGQVLKDEDKRAAYDNLGHETFIERYGPRGNKQEIRSRDTRTHKYSTSATGSQTGGKSNSETTNKTDSTSKSDGSTGRSGSTGAASESADSSSNSTSSSSSTTGSDSKSSTSSSGSSATSTSSSSTGSSTGSKSQSTSGSTGGSASNSSTRNRNHNYRADSGSASTSTSSSRASTRSEYREQKRKEAKAKSDEQTDVLDGWLNAEWSALIREVLVGGGAGVGGVALSLVFMIAAGILFLLVGVVNVVLGILFWLAGVFGVISGTPIPNGVLPDPYFTYLMELLAFGGILLGTGFLHWFLKPIDSDIKELLSYQLPIPTLTTVIPTAAFAFLYGLHVDVPILTAAVTPYAPDVSASVLFTAMLFTSLSVTNRARRVVGETVLVSSQTYGRGGPAATFDRVQPPLQYSIDLATIFSISGIALVGFWEGLSYLITFLPGGNEESMTEFLELTPTPETVFFVVTTLAIIAFSAAVLYRIGYGIVKYTG